MSSGSNNDHRGRGFETRRALIGVWAIGLSLTLCLATAGPVSAEKANAGRRYAFQFEGNQGMSAAALRRSASAELDAFVQNGGREADLEDAVFQMEITYRGEGHAFATVSYTRAVREDDQRGRHTTTGRSMYRLSHGGWLIDTPGMRELQLVDVGDVLDEVFRDVAELAAQCRFADCSHESEPGCAVL